MFLQASVLLPQNDSIPFEGYHEPFYDDCEVPDIWGSECDIDTSSEEDNPGTMFSQIQLQEAAQKLAETALEAAISGAVADVIQVCCLLDLYMLASSSYLHNWVVSVSPTPLYVSVRWCLLCNMF